MNRRYCTVEKGARRGSISSRMFMKVLRHQQSVVAVGIMRPQAAGPYVALHFGWEELLPSGIADHRLIALQELEVGSPLADVTGRSNGEFSLLHRS